MRTLRQRVETIANKMNLELWESSTDRYDYDDFAIMYVNTNMQIVFRKEKDRVAMLLCFRGDRDRKFKDLSYNRDRIELNITVTSKKTDAQIINDIHKRLIPTAQTAEVYMETVIEKYIKEENRKQSNREVLEGKGFRISDSPYYTATYWGDNLGSGVAQIKTDYTDRNNSKRLNITGLSLETYNKLLDLALEQPEFKGKGE